MIRVTRVCQVGDAGLGAVKDLVLLTYLDLGNTDVGDLGLACLTGLRHMRELELHSTPVTDTGEMSNTAWQR